jgi:hypothetical protein
MKCKGCQNQSNGVDVYGITVKYCIGSPESEPKYGSEKFLDTNRIIFTDYHPIYRAEDNDECHCWFSDRFDLKNREGV